MNRAIHLGWVIYLIGWLIDFSLFLTFFNSMVHVSVFFDVQLHCETVRMLNGPCVTFSSEPFVPNCHLSGLDWRSRRTRRAKRRMFRRCEPSESRKRARRPCLPWSPKRETHPQLPHRMGWTHPGYNKFTFLCGLLLIWHFSFQLSTFNIIWAVLCYPVTVTSDENFTTELNAGIHGFNLSERIEIKERQEEGRRVQREWSSADERRRCSRESGACRETGVPQRQIGQWRSGCRRKFGKDDPTQNGSREGEAQKSRRSAAAKGIRLWADDC